MGRHLRRGHVGQTNLSSTHKNEPHSRHLPEPATSHRLSAALQQPPVVPRKRQQRTKWRLDLAPLPHEPFPERRSLDGESIEAQLAANIEAVQHDRKSFKDEQWYRSPIGRGGKSSVVLSALKQHDLKDTGFLPRASIIHTLQQSHFGLSEAQIQTLLKRYDPAQELIHYKTFVQHLHFTELPCESTAADHDDHDIIFRHQTYLEKIHQHASRLIDTSNAAGATLLATESPSKSPLRLSPMKISAPATMITNSEPSVVVGNSPTHHSPLARLAPREFERYHDDLLSFENDKLRKARRAQTKASVLLAHINRIDEYAHRQDVLSLQHDHQRIAAKTIHHGEHLARVFEEQHRQLHRLENQRKALVVGKSPLRQAQCSVSKDSMFYVDPNKG